MSRFASQTSALLPASVIRTDGLMSFGFVVGWIATCLTLGCATPAAGQLVEPVVIPAIEVQRVKFWLDAAWTKSLDHRNRSTEMLELAPVNDVTVMLAYALNRLQHNQARQASEALAKATAIAPSNIDVKLLDVWVKALRDEYDASLVGMGMLARMLARRDLPDDRLDTTYRRIGRLLGYLQGPVGDRANQEILRAAINELSVDLAPRHQKVMMDELNAVVADYENQLEGLGTKVEQSIAEKKEMIEADRKVIEQENTALQTQAKKLEDRKADVETEAQRRVDAALARAQPLQSQLGALQVDIEAVEFQIRGLQTSLFFHFNDPNGSPFLFDLLRFRIQEKFFQLGNIGNQADALRFQLNQISTEVSLIRQQFGGQVSQLEKDFRAANQQQRLNARRLGKLTKPAKPNAKKVSLLTNRITALGSYDQLPLELYRGQLLQAAK